MKDENPGTHTRTPGTLKRRELLCAVAAGGALIAAHQGAVAQAAPGGATGDPQLRAALLKYGGEFGGPGKGGAHGDL